MTITQRDNVRPICSNVICSIVCIWCTVVGFDPVSYSVIEGVNPSAILTIVRSGNLQLPANVTFMTIPGSADGMHGAHTCIHTCGSTLAHLYMLTHVLAAHAHLSTYADNMHGAHTCIHTCGSTLAHLYMLTHVLAAHAHLSTYPTYPTIMHQVKIKTYILFSQRLTLLQPLNLCPLSQEKSIKRW